MNYRKVVHWLLLLLVILYLLSGLGITQYQTVESLSFGLLTKPISFMIHDALLISFLAMLILHIYITVFEKRKRITK
ncbi:hypothetical protein KJ780_02805 [Candidatus Micrarchaeota archaeon]|nr:hypothetical protein [Candidatus Micrarchaeota archaeon]